MKSFFKIAITLFTLSAFLYSCNDNKKQSVNNHEMNLGNIDFAFVEGGTFTMGCTEEQGGDCYGDEKPAHKETVKDFYISKYEITVEQFSKFIEETNYQTEAEKKGKSIVWLEGEKRPKKELEGVTWKCNSRGELFEKSEWNHPVTHVSWNDAKAYCEWLSQKVDKEIRLPSEQEWEYAARGGNNSSGTKYSGSNIISEVAWYDANSACKTQPVGKKKANELGIFDMSGNVYEWCNSWYSNCGNEQSDIDEDYDNRYVIVRGGSAFLNEKFSRVSYRYSRTPSSCSCFYGFRIVAIEN